MVIVLWIYFFLETIETYHNRFDEETEIVDNLY